MLFAPLNPDRNCLKSYFLEIFSFSIEPIAIIQNTFACLLLTLLFNVYSLNAGAALDSFVGIS
jgi:hypothetical protein